MFKARELQSWWEIRWGHNKKTNINNFDCYRLYVDILKYNAVARGGIEPPTHGFSVRFKLLLLNYIE